MKANRGSIFKLKDRNAWAYEVNIAGKSKRILRYRTTSKGKVY